ncbi:MAG TPA: glycosyltransferase family 9 protein [Ktedonobacteraceae bacterium]
MTHKIAIFRALYLGDMLLAVPALRAIRQHFPGSEITLIGLPWAATFVARYTDYLDRFVEFMGYPGLQEVEFCPERSQAFIEAQRAYQYDLVIQMHGSGLSSNSFIHELQAGMSVGYFPGQDAEAGSKLTLGIPYPIQNHEIYRNLGLAKLFGCKQLDPSLEFPLWTEDFREINHVLAAFPQKANTPWIGMHVGAKHPARRWSPLSFARLADALTQNLHAKIILTGGTDERSTIRKVIRCMASEPINLAGQTSLGGLAALLSQLDLFISNDTGPAHLAYALDIPSITLFGPTDYQRWRPLAQDRHIALRAPVACSPCTYHVCPIDHRCLSQISPSLVLSIATKYLENASLVYRNRRNMPVLS